MLLTVQLVQNFKTFISTSISSTAGQKFGGIVKLILAVHIDNMYNNIPVYHH